MDIVNNGHTVQVNYASGSTLVVASRRYELEQFHFHAPSENHVEGKSFALEAHPVHADEHGNLAVVALGSPGGAESLLPARRDYYRFSGSLTTPPCSEGGLWIGMKETVSVSDAQVAAFTGAIWRTRQQPACAATECVTGIGIGPMETVPPAEVQDCPLNDCRQWPG